MDQCCAVLRFEDEPPILVSEIFMGLVLVLVRFKKKQKLRPGFGYGFLM